MGLKIKLTKSAAGASSAQRRTLEGLGLWRFGQERLLKDTPAIRGMVFHVKHLVSQEVVKQEPAPKKRTQKRRAKPQKAERRQNAASP